jgi:hypothetical protein
MAKYQWAISVNNNAMAANINQHGIISIINIWQSIMSASSIIAKISMAIMAKIMAGENNMK